MGGMFSSKSSCVFCEITKGLNNPETINRDKILAYNDRLALFSDLHPATKHHYLVIPRVHVTNPKTLKGQEHIALIEEMYQFGKEYLHSVETEEKVNDCVFGFHMPPLISVEHLHLHIICPASSMKLISSYIFWKDSWYFVSPEKMIENLKANL